MSTPCYDKFGNRITATEWSRLFENRDYQRILQHSIGDALVSTVWIGLDHSHAGVFSIGGLIPKARPRPLIFETKVFAGPGHAEIDGYTMYAPSEAIARANHAEVVRQLKASPSIYPAASSAYTMATTMTSDWPMWTTYQPEDESFAAAPEPEPEPEAPTPQIAAVAEAPAQVFVDLDNPNADLTWMDAYTDEDTIDPNPPRND